ncbi:pyridoxamine 5'-phosphate oxidase family protein [Irregularibacter muris]|uniref:Pyridoxamine 5'-phosphate oxidase family protein n=1 Tax=Irregularibacter muris TaxID=1796619 RepID=A0AAE3HJ34_9FIRM|nr:pyridoxamine 5'-phosphate oxidase family protein [Irregularibacter muris]MCR1900118.1 pyridoxamine 5'-phosphate oxidase family protein [Irregularibacter muris]
MENKKMSFEQLEHHIEKFLKEHKSASIATCMNEIPRSSPVQYYLGEELNIYIPSAGGEKFKAIEKNPKVCLLVNTEYVDYRKIKGVQIFGQARTSLEDKGLIEEAKKYIAHAHLLEEEKLQVIKIIPEEIIYLDAIDRGDRTKQVLKLMDKQVTIQKDDMLVYL